MTELIQLVSVKTKEEHNDFLKTRIEFLHLSKRTKSALSNANIRTIGGIIRKNGFSLSEIDGLGVSGIKDIKRLLQNSFDVIVSSKKYGQEKLEFVPKFRIIENQKINTEQEFIIKDDTMSNPNPADSFDVSFLKEQNEGNGKDVISMFAFHFGVQKGDLLSKSRKKEYVFARDVLIYCLREYADMSFPAMGRMLGGRNHTTIIHSYKKIRDYLLKNTTLENELKDLVNKIKEEKENNFNQILSSNLKDNLFVDKPQFKIKIIPERNIKIFELYKEKSDIKSIIKSFKVSHQRVYQIIKSTIRQSIINNNLKNNLELNDALLEKEEEKIFGEIRQKRKPTSKIKIKREHKWSYKYSFCIICNNTEFKHYRKGLCEVCGNRSIYGNEREEIIKKHNSMCDFCGISRDEARLKYGRDFYLSRFEKSVICRKCHTTKTGKKLGESKKNKWKKFYKDY